MDPLTSNQLSDPKYKEEILSCLEIARDSQEEITLNGLIRNLASFIASTYSGEDVIDFKSKWLRRFLEVARLRGIEVIKDNVDWEVVFGSTLPADHANVTQAIKTAHSTSNSARKMSESDMDRVKAIYKSLKEEKMWVLSTGTRVEKQMEKFALKCQYEHLAHSLIMDPFDQNWKEYFSEDELRELCTHGDISLPVVPDDMKDYLETYVDKNSLVDLDKYITSQKVFSFKDTDLHWVQQTMFQASDLYFFDFFPITTETESDFLSHIWKPIRSCFMCSKIKTHCGEKSSKASSCRRNSGRSASAAANMPRKLLGRRADMMFQYKTYELGCAEAGYVDRGPKGTKELCEGTLKLPKMLKDMALQLISAGLDETTKVKTIGFLMMGLQISLLVLDIPAGYVCRVLRSPRYEFPSSVELMPDLLPPIIKLVWKARTMMESIITLLKRPKNRTVELITRLEETLIPPCALSPSSSCTTSSSVSKRSRQSNTD